MEMIRVPSSRGALANQGQDCIPSHSVAGWRQDRNHKENSYLRRPIVDVGVAKWQTLLATRLTSQPFGPMEFSLDPHSTSSLPKTSKRALSQVNIKP
jgi:hypothetical protein